LFIYFTIKLEGTSHR